MSINALQGKGIWMAEKAWIWIVGGQGMAMTVDHGYWGSLKIRFRYQQPHTMISLSFTLLLPALKVIHQGV